jgi:3-oxoacyl-[acyl-carrier protein] reductase
MTTDHTSAARKTVIVLGAAGMGSIGHAVAVRAAKDGAHVVVADIERPPHLIADVERSAGWTGLPSVLAEIRAHGGTGIAVHCDVTSRDEVEELVRAAQHRGPVTGLVNSTRAGLEPSRPSIEMDEQVWRRTFDVNVTGALTASSAVARAMIANGTTGSIVHISSVAGLHPLRGRTAYSVTKAALNMLTRSMSLDLAPAGIRVNAVCPGIIGTNRVDPDEQARARRLGLTVAQQRQRLLEQQSAVIPLGRVGLADEVASTVAFLLSDNSSYLTGELISVSGGQFVPLLTDASPRGAPAVTPGSAP